MQYLLYPFVHAVFFMTKILYVHTRGKGRRAENRIKKATQKTVTETLGSHHWFTPLVVAPDKALSTTVILSRQSAGRKTTLIFKNTTAFLKIVSKRF